MTTRRTALGAGISTAAVQGKGIKRHDGAGDMHHRPATLR